ncbi:MAG: oxidoreductase [Myxococcota bacterium]|nr:oxidoreductase [Myxococcota bacterium]
MSRSKWTSEQIPSQNGRVAIVTGANSGIGFETAKALALKGAEVVVACRSRTRGEEAVEAIREAAPGAAVDLMLLDLARLNFVRDFAATFLDKYDRLDLLINNAGVMMPPQREETPDGFELQIGINHLGHFALTLALLERLTATEGSRVVNVSSSAQNFGELDLEDLQWTNRPFKRMGSYGASKVANMLFTLELQRRFREAGVSTQAMACHPGWTRTNLQKNSLLIRMFNPIVAMKPWQGALPTLYAAVSPDAMPGGYYGPDGMGTMRGYPASNKPADASTNVDAAKHLWHLSEDLVGIPAPNLEANSVTNQDDMI